LPKKLTVDGLDELRSTHKLCVALYYGKIALKTLVLLRDLL